MTNNLVINNNGVATTTSLKIAEVFNKQHRDVLKKINTLQKQLNSADFDTERNFALSEYNDITGRKLPCYNLTRDGFTLLVMGFTGKDALKFKLAYINQFNKMEEVLRYGRQQAQISSREMIKGILEELLSMVKGDKTAKLPSPYAPKSMIEFVHKYIRKSDEITSCADVYNKYFMWCIKHGHKPESTSMFGRYLYRIGVQRAYKRVGEKGYRCLVEEDTGTYTYKSCPVDKYTGVGIYKFKDGFYYRVIKSVIKPEYYVRWYNLKDERIAGNVGTINDEEFRNNVISKIVFKTEILDMNFAETI